MRASLRRMPNGLPCSWAARLPERTTGGVSTVRCSPFKSVPEQVLTQYFEPATLHKKEFFWTTTAIQKELSLHLKAADVPTLVSLSASLKKLRWHRIKNNGIRGYYLKLKS